MSLAEYQKQIDDWAQELQTPYWSPLSQLARLIEEVGETARVLNHMFGEKVKKPTEEPDDLKGELGDILFDIICLANTLDINLDEALSKVIDKAKVRDKDRYKKKES